jgi:hypothetical protein
MQAAEIEREILRILEQGAAAMRKIVDAYVAQRTPERDRNWICLQMAKEFGAIALHTDRVKLAIEAGKSPREVDDLVETVKEEVAHYQGYRQVLNRLVGEDAELPVPDMYEYLLMDVRRDGMHFHPVMARSAGRWPENRRYVQMAMDAFRALDRWSAAVVAATFEGGAAGWHWAMSQMPAQDEFLKGAAQVQRGIALDELHHGPEEIRGLMAQYREDMNLDLPALFRTLREMRYQEARQRNEQFLHPLGEAEMEALRRELLEDTIEPLALYREAA